jgi:hypothetical protein
LTELELVALWTVLCTAGVRLAVWLLLFIAVRTGSQELTVTLRPGQRFKKTAPSGNGTTGKAGGKQEPAPEGTVPGA